MELKNLIAEPPGQWRFTEHSTGLTMTARPLYALMQKVQQHRINRKLPIVSPGFANLAEEIQDQICQGLDEKNRQHWCKTTAIRVTQPGAIFAHIVHKLTGESAMSCGRCAQRMRWMNNWGWIGCVRHRHEIIGWLVAEAKKRGHPVTPDAMLPLFRAAWKELRTRKPNNTR